MNRVHLDRMPKARLIAMIHEANARADHWRRLTAGLASQPVKRRPVTVAQTLEDAADILAKLPPDPHAAEHRAVLWQETAPKPRPATPIEHGTVSGYRKHQRRAQQPCPDCKQAVAEYERGRKQVA